MKPILLKAASRSLIAALLLTFSLNIPILGMFTFLLTIPLHFIWPGLSETSDLIGYGFMWFEIKQAWVLFVIFTYFFIACFLMYSVVAVIFFGPQSVGNDKALPSSRDDQSSEDDGYSSAKPQRESQIKWGPLRIAAALCFFVMVGLVMFYIARLLGLVG